MQIAPGTRLGPYEILANLGEGGMGEVWKARDTRLGRTVAVKISKAEFTERFEREARAVAALNHPNICQLYDIGPDYLVMEFLEGAPLSGPIPLDKAVDHASQILDALDAAHRKGIVHRDLKPANILVTRQGIKLLDFGLAKQSAPLQESDRTLTEALTSKGQILGTLQYMSPEQLQGEEATPRSDLFSFGCVFYEMLTGRRAFDGLNAASVITSIMSAQPAPLDTAFLPAAVVRLLRTCLEKDPADRWQTASDLRRELRWAASAGDAVAKSVPPAMARWRWVWVLGAAVGILIGAAFTSLLRKPQPELPVRLSIVPPENGTVTAFSISPDGRSFAFPVEKDGKSQIWVRRLDSDTAERVAGTEGAGADEVPAWSPDGEQLAFVAGETLKLVPLRGGKVKELTRARNRGIAWNVDGVILFVDFSQSICRIPAAGGTPEKLAGLNLNGAEGARFPVFLPDGNRFLYVTRSLALGQDNIQVGSLDGKTNKRILAQQRTAVEVVADPGGPAAWLLYDRDGSLLAHRFNLKSLELEGKPVALSDSVGAASGGTGRSLFAVHREMVAYRAGESGLSRLVWYDASGKRLEEIGGHQFLFGEVHLSPDGRQALVDAREGRSGGYVESVDLSSRTPTRRTFDAKVRGAFWSPDGRTIILMGQSDGKSQIYQSPADWSSPPQLLHEQNETIITWDLHPGQQTFLAFTSLARARAITRGTSGWAVEKILGDEPFMKGKFSPDGHWVVYQTAGLGLYAVPYPPTGAKWQISPDGVEPVWRRDGKEIYFIRGDEIMAVSVDGSDRSLKVGAPRSLFRVALPPRMIPSHRFDVTADGKKFLVIERLPDSPGVPFTVLLNWRALLERP